MFCFILFLFLPKDFALEMRSTQPAKQSADGVQVHYPYGFDLGGKTNLLHAQIKQQCNICNKLLHCQTCSALSSGQFLFETEMFYRFEIKENYFQNIPSGYF